MNGDGRTFDEEMDNNSHTTNRGRERASQSSITEHALVEYSTISVLAAVDAANKCCPCRAYLYNLNEAGMGGLLLCC